MKAADYCADIAKALEMGTTEGEWRKLHTRIDSACGYQILHIDLHGKTERERDANREYVAACHPAALRSILEEREQNRAAREQDAMAVAKMAEEVERLRRQLAEAQKDSARLDWLEHHDGEFYNLDRVSCIVGIGFFVANQPKVKHSNVRAAIDAVMGDPK